MSTHVTNSILEMELHKAIEYAVDSSIYFKKNKKLFNIFYLLGTPGGGKTMMTKNHVEKLGLKFLSYEPGLERMEKFGGIPDVKSGKEKKLLTVWSIPEIIHEINEEASKNEYVVVLLDDWHLCDSEIQKIGFELFTYYSLNGHKISDNVIFILAGNEKSTAGAKTQLSAIRGRCKVIKTRSSVENWIDNFAIPNNINEIGISYFKDDSKHMYFQMDESTIEQFGSARSWTSLFNNLDYIKENNVKLSNSELLMLFSGDVGPVAASDFKLYYDFYINVPTKVIFNTGKFEIPQEACDCIIFIQAILNEYKRLYDANDPMYHKTFYNIVKGLKDSRPELTMKLLMEFMSMDNDGINKALFLIENGYWEEDTMNLIKDMSSRFCNRVTQ